MAFIDGTALNVAMPAIQTALHAHGADLLWVANAYLIVLASLILVGGGLGDRLGRKRVFGAGILLFTLASAASGASPSIGFLIDARAVQGMGGALMIPGSLSLIAASVAPERRGRAIGTWSAATTLVTIAGPALGGILSDLGLWRLVFLINVPLGIASLLALAWVRESLDESIEGPLDVAGAVLATLALAALAWGFIEAADRGFGDAAVLSALGGGLISFLAFILVEARVPSPMLPLSFFRNADFSGTNLLTFLLYGALSAAMFFLALDLVQAQGYSKTLAGLTTLPFALILAAMARWAGGVADRRGPREFLILGPSLVAFGFLWLGLFGGEGGPRAYWSTILPGILLFGLGMGCTVAPLSSTVMGALPRRHVGTASGVNNAVARAAGALAIAILGSAAILAFSSSLSRRAADLGLGEAARAALALHSQDLGATSVPPGLAPDIASAVQGAIDSSLSAAFRLVELAASALAAISAFVAFVTIGRRKPALEDVTRP